MKIKKGKSMCFFSAKGGIGKTTNLLNFAGVLEQMEKKVLIIDFDLYSGGVAVSLNKNGDKSVYNLSEDLMNNSFAKIDDYVVRYDNYIDLLCAPVDPRYANKVYAKNVSKIIELGSLNYDVVLVDMNHSLDEINLNILDSVDKVLFMISNDVVDLKNMRSVISIFNSLDISNYKLMLNLSRDPYKNYFSNYDIKKILHHNIDYCLSNELYLKDMDKYVVGGYIVSLDKKFSTVMRNDYQTFVVMATDLLEEEENE